MVIYRNGQAIELTAEECRKVYVELDREYHKEDIYSRLETLEIELDDYHIDDIVDLFVNALDHNDDYFDCYWCTMDYVIQKYINELEMKKNKK